MARKQVSVEKSIIVDEHKRLNEMLSSIMFFIQNMQKSSISPEAVDVLYERMQAHFRIEEQMAKQFEEQSFLILRDAHDALLSILNEVKNCQDRGEDHEGKRLLSSFTEALDRHDNEVDIPLFNRMTGQQKSA